MKKAKLILGAVAVLAIVGGTFAAKASKSVKRNAVIYCSTSTTTYGTTLRNFTISTEGFPSLCTNTTNAYVVSTLITELQ
jgi:hypothetical protein